jgi:magnesium chelatase subunit D
MPFETTFPFTAIVGQETMKRALLLNAIYPEIGGVLIRGQRGTAKSTAVRGLARLLPDYDAVERCLYRCDPATPETWCTECRDRAQDGPLPVTRVSMRIVDLPINASEDRLVGTIDIESAIRSGTRRFEPGVLAEANRNLLYVDEVNLLDDHLVDVLLDAAAMGVNVVERESISVSHPARVILVGTMNPEEGELRPQLLDRFGLCVDVAGVTDIDQRVRIIEAEQAFLADPTKFQAETAAAQEHLCQELRAARTRLNVIETPEDIRTLIARLCLDEAVAGHRADLVVAHTARAICAMRAGGTVELPDVLEALELGLAHRRRDVRGERTQAAQEMATRAAQELVEIRARSSLEKAEGAQGEGGAAQGAAGSDAKEGWAATEPLQAQATDADEPESERVIELKTFTVKRFDLPRERKTRRVSGKRAPSKSETKRGRYVRSTQVEKTTDVAFDATLRAAAPHQIRRRTSTHFGEPALRLEMQDLRQKVRQRRTGNLIVFVVDASASMDAEQRMLATKGAILSLLRDAYVRRDKVALVAFSGRSARIALRPTSSVDLAERRLERLSVGGTTPLTHGLVTALKLVKTERLRDPAVYPLLVLISDGRGNISLFGEEPLVEAQRAAGQIRTEGIRAMVIDSTRDHRQRGREGSGRVASLYGAYAFNVCGDLAERLGGRYYGLYDLSQRSIMDSIEREISRTNSA